ncbi:MarR family transcriptional regulator [Nocardioides mangrovicus]|uniref:MarR family transcriptional regulator n=1 Tax=Nocardioides mangrovicus TaxID=2478913 RepID=A0A3L8P5R4_9ACTN|nr:MarR family transcriptional regulator [Nocardioides mangrovicus]RLV49748.1 MarR family transcriptional regulator [Nocardioides mangrovicus]
MDPRETQWLTVEQQRIWRAYIMGSQLLQDRLDRDLRVEHGISLTEYEILVRLSEIPERRMRMALLADSVCHSRSRVTHTVARMESAGWLRREEAADDGRGVDAVMTAAGGTLLEQAAHTHVEGVRRNLVDLVGDDDFEALGRVMNTVSDRLLAGRTPAADIR